MTLNKAVATFERELPGWWWKSASAASQQTHGRARTGPLGLTMNFSRKKRCSVPAVFSPNLSRLNAVDRDRPGKALQG